MAVLFYAATILFVSDMATLLISVFVSGIVYSVIFYVLAGSELRHDMKKILLK
jgi:hypothetical protein